MHYTLKWLSNRLSARRSSLSPSAPVTMRGIEGGLAAFVELGGLGSWPSLFNRLRSGSSSKGGSWTLAPALGAGDWPMYGIGAE